MLDMFGQTQIALIIHFVMIVIDPVYPIGGAVYYIGQVHIVCDTLFVNIYSKPKNCTVVLSNILLQHHILFYLLVRYMKSKLIILVN